MALYVVIIGWMSRQPLRARRMRAYAPGKEGRNEAEVMPFEEDDSKFDEPSSKGSAETETHPPHVGWTIPACIPAAHTHESALQVSQIHHQEDIPIGRRVPTTNDKWHAIHLLPSYPSGITQVYIPTPTQTPVLSPV